MGFITQIGGGCANNSSSILKLKHKLKAIDVDVAQARSNSPLSYDGAINYYSSIAQTNLHFVCNDGNTLGHIDDHAALEIMHAMVKRRPIVLLHAPVFEKNVGTFARNVIANRLSKLMVCNILDLDDEDALNFVQNIAENDVNYTLTQHEETIIKARVRAHFRKLLPAVA